MNKYENNSSSHILIPLGVIIALTIFVTIIVERILRKCIETTQKEVWDASIPSYWGGIIGGVISGTLAFLGVFYTIRYYKESDAKKERASVQPFLMVDICSDERNEAYFGFTVGEVSCDTRKTKTFCAEIKNVGNGFAKTIVIYTGACLGGAAFSRVINAGDSVYLNFCIDSDSVFDGQQFSIRYVDSMANEYLQKYVIKREYVTDTIECGYPQLMK